MTMYYWKSTCSTARNVRAALRERHPDLPERNYGKDALTPAEVLAIVAAAGGVANVMNARHEIAKDRGWKASPPDAETFARAAADECNLLRRPILVKDGRTIVGNEVEAMLAALAR
jgi:arsenate reductase-like glutaredoxin family protein